VYNGYALVAHEKQSGLAIETDLPFVGFGSARLRPLGSLGVLPLQKPSGTAHNQGTLLHMLRPLKESHTAVRKAHVL
jgi:hypothetical protein